jgi:putative hemolysin
MKKPAIALLLVLAVLAAGCIGTLVDTEDANAASEYCVEQGGTVVVRETADGGHIGYCVFPDGSDCEQWEFYRGECTP